MPWHLLVLAVAYLAALIALFLTYVMVAWLRAHLPANLGQLPVGVVWFGATGAVMASLYGIFVYNQKWDTSYNYWHYCRPLFGAVTGSIGALIYLVLLHLGSASIVKVDPLTFYVVAFVLGFADKSFVQLLQNVTTVVIKPGNQPPKTQ
jgi:H+/Cl- antiporter ClcA